MLVWRFLFLVNVTVSFLLVASCVAISAVTEMAVARPFILFHSVEDQAITWNCSGIILKKCTNNVSYNASNFWNWNISWGYSYCIITGGSILLRQWVVSQLLTMCAWVHTRVSLFEICDGQSGSGTGFSTSRSFHSAAYSLMCHQGHEQWAC